MQAAGILGLRRQRLRLAKPEEVAATGFKIGAVPPLGHKERLHTIIDRKASCWNAMISRRFLHASMSIMDHVNGMCHVPMFIRQ